MATLFSRSLPKTLVFSSIFSRSFLTATNSAASHSSFSLLRRLRPLSAIVAADLRRLSPALTLRDFATRATSSSLNDPNPNWSNRPPKETILLDGCDFEHWLVVMEKPEGDPTRDEIIDSYIKTLASIVGSEEEARMKIYSVSTRCYYAFGCLVSEELSYKIKELPKVRWVLPDSYLDVKNKDYGGEPFINGQAVPYDPKYHEEWQRNNARANERNRRTDRPRQHDRSRNFERRRENMQNREFPNGPAPSNMPPNNMPPHNHAGMPQGPPPPNNFGPPPPNNFGPPPPNNYGPPPPNNFNQPPPQRSYAPPPPFNSGPAPPPPFNSGPAPPPPFNSGPAPPPPFNSGPAPPPPFNSGPAPPPPFNSGPAPPPPFNSGPAPPRNFGPQQSNHGGPQPNNQWGAPQTNYNPSGPPPPQNGYGEMPPNAGGWSSNVHNNQRD